MNLRSVGVLGKQLALLIMLWGFSASAAESMEFCTDSSQQYWKIFRSAALGNNLSVVADLACFPFEVKGTLDDSRAEKITRKDFIKRFPSLLKEDSGLTSTPTTMRALLKANEQLSQTSCNPGGNQFRVGAWVFQLKSKGWCFVQAFVHD